MNLAIKQRNFIKMGAFQFNDIKLEKASNELLKENYKKFSIDQEKTYNYFSKEQQEIYKSFIMDEEGPNKNKKIFSDSIFIFDWDDTLMCTSFLAPFGILDEMDLKLDPSQAENIKILDEAAFKLLFSTIVLGDTYVITNATISWVLFSAKKFYPKVSSLLKKVKIISARELYEKHYPLNNKKWKMHTFLDIKRRYFSNTDINIICIGDSNLEIQAANALAAEFKTSYLKTIKLRESPKIEELIKQINLIVINLKKIYEEKKNLKITVEKKNLKIGNVQTKDILKMK